MLNKQRGETMKTSGDILASCTQCLKIGPYNQVKAWSVRGYDRLDFAFCSEDCARDFEQNLD
jgi:hypothetical protein